MNEQIPWTLIYLIIIQQVHVFTRCYPERSAAKWIQSEPNGLFTSARVVLKQMEVIGTG